MNNKKYFDPFYSEKNPKDMTKEELRERKKLHAKIKKETFGELFKYLVHRKVLIFGLIVLAILNGLFFSSSSFIIGIIIDRALGFDQLKIGGNFSLSTFILSIVALVVVYLLGKLIDIGVSLICVKMATNATKLLRSDAYKALMKMPISFFDSINTGEVMSIISNDADNILFGLSDVIAQLITSIFAILFSFGFMIYLSLYLTLITIVLIPLMFSFVGLIMKKAMPQFQKQQTRLASMTTFVQEYLTVHHLIKSFNQTETIKDKFDKITKKYFNSAFKANLYSEIIYPYSNAAIFTIQFIVAAIGITFALSNIGNGWNKTITVGLLISFGIYIRLMSYNITFFFQNFTQFQMALVSTSRILKISKLVPPTNEDKLEKMDDVKGIVEFKNVSFSYTNDPNNLQLKNASFIANKGQTFAIVGPTGAGKTTIINLLSKFYLPLSGKILIDGKESTSINEKYWRDQISIVLQDTFLFKTTIMENLRYANKDATDEQIIAAAKMSRADEFIQQLKDGYNEIIQEGGANLSHGERQLIAITRAILANKNILILDEATSNIDTRTEKFIQDAILELMREKTAFVIAHRLSTIVNADKILVVNGGEIIESGTHEELLAKKGFYEKLYHSAFVED